MLIAAESESEEWESYKYQESDGDVIRHLVVLLPVDDGPDARKGHDTKADPYEDAHVRNAANDVADQGCKIHVIR